MITFSPLMDIVPGTIVLAYFGVLMFYMLVLLVRHSGPTKSALDNLRIMMDYPEARSDAVGVTLGLIIAVGVYRIMFL